MLLWSAVASRLYSITEREANASPCWIRWWVEQGNATACLASYTGEK
jgi:hypothetical protein